MNAIVQKILAEQVDFILPKIKEKHDKIVDRAQNWIAGKDQVLPVLLAFQALGGNISVDGDCDIIVGIAGDKDCFINCWKLWRSCGVRLDTPPPGATSVNQLLTAFGIKFYFCFSSTVCKRVQVGTKMVETPVFETQCGTDLNTIKQEELEGPSGGELVPLHDDIPF